MRGQANTTAADTVGLPRELKTPGVTVSIGIYPLPSITSGTRSLVERNSTVGHALTLFRFRAANRFVDQITDRMNPENQTGTDQVCDHRGLR
jgi:hypothetical protein